MKKNLNQNLINLIEYYTLLNSNLLLTLEACRGVLKVCAIEQKKIVWSNLNKYLESNGFK